MFTLSESAKKELEAFFSQNERSHIRIFPGQSACTGSKLALALDTPDENDNTFQLEGYDFCIEKSLLDLIKGASIDLSYKGFVVEPIVDLPQKKSSCSSKDIFSSLFNLHIF